VGSSCNTKSSLGLDEFGGELIRGSARTDFLPWPEWRRDGAPGWWGTELDGNGGGGGPAQEIREWDGGSGVWALKERRGWGPAGAARGARGYCSQRQRGGSRW
jgi:hypothetical protein